jgi:predicted phosphodiesterase
MYKMSDARYGFIGDVHGDIEALRWALDRLADCERIFCLGDIVDGPRDRDCIELLRQGPVTVLRGNHDHWAQRDTFMRSRHSDEERQWLASLPLFHEEDGWRACHSRYDVEGKEVFWEYIDHDGAARKLWDEHAQPVTLCGHTHIPAVHVLEHDRVVYRGTSFLQQESSSIVFEPGKRYIVNVGRPTMCVVMLRANQCEFRFRAEAPPPQAVPTARKSRWQSLWDR